MFERYFLLYLISFCLVALPGCQSSGGLRPLELQSDVALQPEKSLDQVSQCQRMLEEKIPANAGKLDAEYIQLLSWNIKKGKLNDWLEDLKQLSKDKNLVLIQEARHSMGSELAELRAGYWSFAPGYVSAAGPTGVATFSSAAPIGHCRLTAMEPWLRTPKATNLTRYALKDSEQSLVVANIHMVNFTIGHADFRAQLQTIIDLLAQHQGLLIVSGDFNTWRAERQQVMEELMAGLNLTPVQFRNDQRSQFFGRPVDHIYIGGFKVDGADSYPVESSDHNPLTTSLRSVL